MPKNIVVCCDGTSNEITSDSTNVLRLYRMLVRDEAQVAYYDAGVGTLADPAAISAPRKVFSTKLDAALGLSVREIFCRAYQFLAHTYESGDRIFLFGFSRGAYAVRGVAGAIHFLGLVRPELATLAPLAWTIYSNADHSLSLSRRFGGGKRFKKCFSVHPIARIHFLGAWDTVSSFGWIWNFRTLPNTADNPALDHARQALAIDERRGCFKANLFNPRKLGADQSIKQVWFAGVHSDVGGGYPEEEAALSKVSLEWMAREAQQHGLRIGAAGLEQILGGKRKASPNPLGPLHESLSGLWQAMEWLPRRTWNGTKERMAWVWPNRGRRRFIEENAILHHSVVERMKHGGYHPPNLPAKFGIEY
jgi:uncharacterized protein (DUF2235 family)